MQNLLQEIASRSFVAPELEQRIKTDFQIKEIPKGTILLPQETRANYLYFIEKGMLHNYYYHDGKQISSWFYKEGQFATSWYSFYTRKYSYEAIESLEDCIVYQISYHQYQELITDFASFGNFARLLAEEMLGFLDQFSKGWSFLTAREKYQLLTSYFPDIELRVKLGFIASFLGISQETLSRLRAKQ
ncbi:Crp/Fnr family transcriptional regulator [Aquimarina sp. TRL1]|uniref:Crp/Fnr family transcriptional regulator n=1 Tax=Aquimarina sp. (strain TRL1) TaxID=2736252 RepID=UPI00158B3CB3|nr:Crp/Fnr family transcriptional regulator [Aquimarina sp. TRL1]QKX06812.1 Crp/Fnr family transcriptional regulator [Aquimarina sp. TRL1]